MKELDNLLPKFKEYLAKAIAFISKHRVVITVIVACSAILASVMQAQGFLNPVRNETLYTEQKASSSTKTIDEEIVKKLSETQTGEDISVDSDFVPDRNNPFNE
jgi:hypothetical protein